VAIFGSSQNKNSVTYQSKFSRIDYVGGTTRETEVHDDRRGIAAPNICFCRVASTIVLTPSNVPVRPTHGVSSPHSVDLNVCIFFTSIIAVCIQSDMQPGSANSCPNAHDSSFQGRHQRGSGGTSGGQTGPLAPHSKQWGSDNSFALLPLFRVKIGKL
jgi:hypothetical protein